MNREAGGFVNSAVKCKLKPPNNSCNFWIEIINMCDIHIATLSNSCNFWIEDINMCNNVYDLHIKCSINNDI